MKYIFSYSQPNNQYIDIEFVVSNIQQDKIQIQLPAWRPGRYELGNFAKNIQKWAAFDVSGNGLPFRKLKKDLWEVECLGESEIHIKYNYYAAELNGGSTWLDDKQLYVNPVNCCLYLPERIDEPCEIELQIPEGYQVATGMKKDKGVATDYPVFITDSFHELADSPFIASASLAHNMFVYEGVEFHIWFQGLPAPNWSKILSDFFVFLDEQYTTFGDFPVKEYHFLFQILPYKAYHGVEHQNSTVIVLGPTYAVMTNALYNEFLGVSSHELFHTWNIKYIRPAEMYPYDYSRENYSRLGYVAEGVTTYYGDLMLFRSGVFKEKEYFSTFNEQLQKHFDNFGRFNLSVADSSFDTWLDGYVPGIPNRKTSIYTEGCLFAFIIDIQIRRETQNVKSLNDVVKILYHDFGKKNKGYTDEDYIRTVGQVAGKSLLMFFERYVYGTDSYREMLDECLQYLGLKIKDEPSTIFQEAKLGFKTIEDAGKTIVKNVFPDSISSFAGLMMNDQIVAVNGIRINGDLSEWCKYFTKDSKSSLNFTVFSSGLKKEISLNTNSDIYYRRYSLVKLEVISTEQNNAYNTWTKRILTEN